MAAIVMTLATFGPIQLRDQPQSQVQQQSVHKQHVQSGQQQNLPNHKHVHQQMQQEGNPTLTTASSLNVFHSIPSLTGTEDSSSVMSVNSIQHDDEYF